FLARRGFAGADLQALLDSLQQSFGTAQNAWQTRADSKLAPAHWFGMEHVVEGDDFADVRDRDCNEAANPGLCLRRDIALGLLEEPQERQHGCLQVFVALHDLGSFAFKVGKFSMSSFHPT